MNIAVQLAPRAGKPQKVHYTWDSDTEILSAHLKPGADGDGLSGAVGLEGSDGSWVILDVSGGCINAIEIAVWPEIQERSTLAVPLSIEEAAVMLVEGSASTGLKAVEVSTSLVAESDSLGRTFHFRMGGQRESRVVRLASDILLDVDQHDRMAGLWLLNVPPCPSPS